MSAKVDLELLRNDVIGVHFDYDRLFVDALRRLSNRRWNPRERRWEVHLSHLPELSRIFNLEASAVPSPIRDAYAARWGGSAVRVELGPLKARLAGGRPPLEAIDEITSFAIPGRRYSPSFRSGRWDGRRHLLNRRRMEFPSGLWPRVRRLLDSQGIAWNVTETNPAISPPAATFGPVRVALRSYQARAVEEALAAGRGILQIATGGGKTLLAAHLIRTLARPAFFFVHTRDLLHQSAEALQAELGVEVGRLGDGHVDLRPVTVATLQTAARALGITTPAAERDEAEETPPAERPTRIRERLEAIRQAIAAAAVVIFDECHHVPAETAYKVAFKTVGAAWRFGLSATPWRDDHADLLLEAALGDRLCRITCSDLIAEGYLVPPDIRMERSPAGEPIPRRCPYPEVYRRAIVENQSRNRAIAAHARRLAEQGRGVLILVAQVAHGRRLLESLPEARFAYGSLEMDRRRAYLRDLERKLHPLLIATTLADEGLDIPALEAVILAGGGKSATKAYQRVGRALRPAPGKSGAFILDFYDAAPFLEDHSRARLALYRAEPSFKIRTAGFEA